MSASLVKLEGNSFWLHNATMFCNYVLTMVVVMVSVVVLFITCRVSFEVVWYQVVWYQVVIMVSFNP